MRMIKQESRPMSASGYGGARNTANNDRRLRKSSNPRSSQARASVDTPPSSPNQSRRDRARSSCCFSCCGLTVRSGGETGSGSRTTGGANTKDRKPPPTPASAPDVELLPTAEDIKSWGEGFENVMASATGRKWFRDFLRCEYSEENILFWLACEDLKKETNPETVEEKARIIYEDYISILSPKEVSLDSRVREIINRNMVEPSRQTFDEAQIQIFTLMSRDSYPRFVNSALYRQLVDTLLKPQSQNNSGASLQQSNPAQPPQQPHSSGGTAPASSSRNSGLNRDRGSSSAS